jgi:hypothetical protein
VHCVGHNAQSKHRVGLCLACGFGAIREGLSVGRHVWLGLLVIIWCFWTTTIH